MQRKKGWIYCFSVCCFLKKGSNLYWSLLDFLLFILPPFFASTSSTGLFSHFLQILIISFSQGHLDLCAFNYFSFPWGFNCWLNIHRKMNLVIKSLLMRLCDFDYLFVLITDFFFKVLIYSQVPNYKPMTQCQKRFLMNTGPWFLIDLEFSCLLHWYLWLCQACASMLMNRKLLRVL